MGFQIFEQILGKYVSEDGVTEIAIPKGVYDIGPSAFSGCANLTRIEIPDTVTIIRSFAFSHCRGLKTLELPDSVNTIEPNACYWCNGLTSIRFPAGLKIVQHHAFSMCSALQSLELPVGLERIETAAFEGCWELETVTLPSTLTWIGARAFAGCNRVREFRIPEGIQSIAEDAFDTPTPQRLRLLHPVFSPVIFVPALHNWKTGEMMRVMQFYTAQPQFAREALFGQIRKVAHKIPLALFLYLVYDSTIGLDYLQKKPTETLEYLIDEEELPHLASFLSMLVTTQTQADALLTYAITKRKLQAQLLLTRWKHTHFGSADAPLQL